MPFSKPYLAFSILGSLLLFAVSSVAQRPINDDRRADSLDRILRTSTTDTARIEALQSLSNYWLYKDSARAMSYALQSEEAAGKIKNAFYAALSHFYIGNVYMEHYDLPKASEELMKADRLLRNDSSFRGLKYRARIWHNYGAICQRRDDSKQFLDIMLNKVAPLLEKAGDSVTLALTYKDIGMVLMNYGQYDKALVYYNMTIRQFRDNIGYEDLATCYCYAAQTLLFQDKYDQAPPYLEKALSILSHNRDSQEWILYYTVNGMYFYFTKAFPRALDSYDKGLVMARRWKQLYPSLNLLMGKYKIYSEEKNYPLAKNILYELQEKTAGFPITDNKLSMLKNLAGVEEKTGNLKKAYSWLSEYSRLSDSLNEQNSKVRISELETKYQSEKKEKEIVTLHSQTRQQDLVLQHNRLLNYLLLAGILILLLLVFSLFLLYRNKQRLARQQEEDHRQKLKDIEQQQQLAIYNAMLKGQEQERNRLARDLHDGLGGMLAGVKMKLSAFADSAWPGKEERKRSDMDLYKVITQLDLSVQELRRIARDMMPETLLQFGLEPALKELCSSLQTPALQVEFQGYGISRSITPPGQAAIYRIVQELLSNAIRHASATSILVQCSQNENIFFISVEDDGRGFQPEQHKGDGIGLSNVGNRVNFLKGKMDIHSVPGEGTTINIEVHVHE
ncbi:MAG TPA: sensor histidine kinase [Puia sp.]|jgi:signal transduction histidine kinase